MWKYIIIAVAVAAVIGAGIAWRVNDKAHWKQQGYNQCTSDVAVATQKAEAETVTEQKIIRQQSSKVKDEIKRNQTGNRPVSDPIRQQLERMRSRERTD